MGVATTYRMPDMSGGPNCSACIQPNPFLTSLTNTSRTCTKFIPPAQLSTASTCMTTCSRISSRQAIDGQIRDLGAFARRLAAIDPGAADRRRAARAAGAREQHPRPALRARTGPDLGAQSAVLRRHHRDQPRRPGAVRLRAAAERARRIVSKLRQVPRLMQAARDNIKDPPGIFVKVGLESMRGTQRFIDEDLPRAFSRLDDLHILGDLADASMEASARDRRLRRVSREGPRAAQQGILPPRARAVRREAAARRGAHARRRPAARDRDARAARDPGGVPARRVEDQRRDPDAAWEKAKADHPPAGQLVSAAQEQLGELVDVHQQAADRHHPAGRAGRRGADAEVLSLDLRQHVDAGPVRSASAARDLLHHRRRSRVAGGAPGRAPARLQLRRPLVDLDPRGVPRATTCTTSTCARSSRSCASRSCSRPPRWSKAGRTTASR